MTTPRPVRWIVPALVAGHCALFLLAVVSNFAAIDEVGHLPAGVSYWQTGSFRIYRVNPPLPRLLAAIPVLLAGAETDYRSLTDRPGSRPEWQIGIDFAAANGTRYLLLLRLARLSGLLWSLGGAWIIDRWCRDLYGEAAGCLGLALWCFEPTILGHASLVGTDVPPAAAGLAATYAFWRYLKRPSWPGAIGAGALLGVAQLTKFTMLVLYAAWPLLWLIQRAGHDTTAAPWRARSRAAGQAATILALSLLVLNAGYLFAGTGRPLGSWPFVSPLFAGTSDDWPGGVDPAKGGNRFANHWLGRIPVPLPNDYLLGIDEQRRDFESGFESYLAGAWRHPGWWDFYVYALAVKLPLGLWGLIFWNAVLLLSGHPACASRRDELTLLVPAAAILALVSSQIGMTHHMRYVLPALPFVLVSTSKTAWFLRNGPRWAGCLAGALFAWAVASSLAVAPHWLSYFNEAAGGPMRGHDHLVDSNIDWGQDLLALKRWLDAHPEAWPLGLACFHLLDPRSIGIDWVPPPPGPDGYPADVLRRSGTRFGPKPGYYAVSVSFLRGAVFSLPDRRGGPPLQVHRGQFAYFRRFRPIARAGFSIYIYHLTPEQVESVRRDLGLPTLGPGGPPISGSLSPPVNGMRRRPSTAPAHPPAGPTDLPG